MQTNFSSIARAGVQKLLSQRGAVAVRETPRQKILEFIQNLRPVDSGHGLIRLGGAGDGGPGGVLGGNGGSGIIVIRYRYQ